MGRCAMLVERDLILAVMVSSDSIANDMTYLHTHRPCDPVVVASSSSISSEL